MHAIQSISVDSMYVLLRMLFKVYPLPSFIIFFGRVYDGLKCSVSYQMCTINLRK